MINKTSHSFQFGVGTPEPSTNISLPLFHIKGQEQFVVADSSGHHAGALQQVEAEQVRAEKGGRRGASFGCAAYQSRKDQKWSAAASSPGKGSTGEGAWDGT